VELSPKGLLEIGELLKRHTAQKIAAGGALNVYFDIIEKGFEPYSLQPRHKNRWGVCG